MIIPSPRRCLISVPLRLLEIKHFFRLVDGVLLSLTTSLNSVALSISFENLVIPTGTNAHRISYCSPLTKMATHFSIRAVRLLVIKKSLSLTSNVDSRINIWIIYRKSTAHLLYWGHVSFKRVLPAPCQYIWQRFHALVLFLFTFLSSGRRFRQATSVFSILLIIRRGWGRANLKSIHRSAWEPPLRKRIECAYLCEWHLLGLCYDPGI